MSEDKKVKSGKLSNLFGIERWNICDRIEIGKEMIIGIY
jgi:hypothetical protein